MQELQHSLAVVSPGSAAVERNGPCRLVENTDFAPEVEEFAGTAERCFEKLPGYMADYTVVTLVPHIVDHTAVGIVEHRDMVVEQFPVPVGWVAVDSMKLSEDTGPVAVAVEVVHSFVLFVHNTVHMAAENADTVVGV